MMGLYGPRTQVGASRIQGCARVSDLWDGLYSRVARELPAIPSDLELLMLDFAAASHTRKGWWWHTWERLSQRFGRQDIASGLWPGRSWLRPSGPFFGAPTKRPKTKRPKTKRPNTKGPSSRTSQLQNIPTPKHPEPQKIPSLKTSQP